jgi:hypothetical protein
VVRRQKETKTWATRPDGVVEVYQLPSGNAETVGLKDSTSHLQVTIPVTKPEQ